MPEISSATNTNPSKDVSDSVKKNLFTMAMESRWEKVVIEYNKADKLAHKAKITRSGDTALHIAVSDCQEKYVEVLVNQVSEEDLKIQNERGNTPLHLAASMGNVRMCKCIAKKYPSLVGIPNKDKETPLFLAALHGRKEAFLCLHYICAPVESQKKLYSYCRREDGDTILHCAIAGDYFDLAFQIIALYKNLVNYVNEVGFTPLHLLASKASAFKSGSHLRSGIIIIYHCIYVDELKVEQADHFQKRVINPIKEERDPEYPENYKTCINIMRVFRDIAKAVFAIAGSYSNEEMDSRKKPTDAENPKEVDGRKRSTDAENPKASHKLPLSSSESTATEDPEDPKVSLQVHYKFCFDFVKLLSKAMLIVLGLGFTGIKKMRDKKEKHIWAVQIMDELLKSAVMYEYEGSGMTAPIPSHKDTESTMPYETSESGDPITPPTSTTGTYGKGKNGEGSSLPKVLTENKTPEMAKKETPILIAAKNGVTEVTAEKILELFSVAIHDLNTEKKNMTNKETPILIAAKNGVTEMVEKILQRYPVAIHDLNAEKKNIVLLAAENRQPDVYQLLLDKVIMKESAFSKVDKDGNSALHLAAKFGDHKPWLISGAALQMQWEIKWYEYVKSSISLHFFARYNKKNQTAKEIFSSSHTDMVKDGGQWLNNTSQSCSVVAALIAAVAFATAFTVPGGTKEKNGKPNLENQPAFNVFAFSSLVALCLSVISMVMFLAILTSRYQEMDFGKSLPRKLLFGLTSLFLSIAAMLVSFCAGHFFVLKDTLKNAAFPVYAITCLPVTFFAIAQFPLYIDLVRATFKKVPQRSYKE